MRYVQVGEHSESSKIHDTVVVKSINRTVYSAVSPQVSEEQQQKLEEAEGRWRDSLERCEKLKQEYGNLRQEHINLIRAHAETKKSLESQEQLLTDITQQLESKNTGSSQQLRNLEVS